jgi:rhodanese-related sulfurtransferase
LLGEKRPLVLIDVRSAEDHHGAPIPGARAVPLGELLHHIHTFTWGDEIVVLDDSAVRAQSAAERLRKFNFRKTRVLAGGISAWRSAAGAAA